MVFPLGDVVCKIARDREDAVRAVLTDAAMNPVARDLGVQTPECLACDDSREIVPVPYTIIQHVPQAIPLDHHEAMFRELAWWEVGHQLARIHRVPIGALVPTRLRTFRQSTEVDPRRWIETLSARNVLTAPDARWMDALLSRLAPAALANVTPTLCHGDINAANVLVDDTTGAFRALIDWSGAGWLDPVWDFAGVPLAAVSPMLTGHRSIAPLPEDSTAEARIAWCQLQTRLHTALNQPDSTHAAQELQASISQVHRFPAQHDL